MNKNIMWGLAIVLVLSAGYYFINSDTKLSTDTQTNTSKVSTTPETPKYTLSDVSKHSTSADCWTAVNGFVYNITEFIPGHPGGKEIIKACGKDGTSLFKSEREHAEQNAQATLDAYFIGTLSN